MSSREKILRKLHAARRSFPDSPPTSEWRHMVPVSDTTPDTLQSRFIHAAEALGCTVTCFTDSDQARAHVLELIAPDKVIQSWAFEHIPIPRLADSFSQKNIQVVPGLDTARVGLTGADAALAGTGSLVLVSGPGKPRQAALLPPLHIAVITSEQLVPNLDTWIASCRRNDFQSIRTASNSAVISGPSRTGDIANIPVRGVHGPAEVHIVLLAQDCNASNTH